MSVSLNQDRVKDRRLDAEEGHGGSTRLHLDRARERCNDDGARLRLPIHALVI